MSNYHKRTNAKRKVAIESFAAPRKVMTIADFSTPVPITPTIVNGKDLMSDARRLVELYRRRNTLFSQLGAPDIFGDPAWHMLLDLYLETVAQRRVSVSDLCVGSGTPPTTALRHISVMVKRGLLVRVPDATDGRRVFIELALHTLEALRGLFDHHGAPEGR